LEKRVQEFHLKSPDENTSLSIESATISSNLRDSYRSAGL